MDHVTSAHRAPSEDSPLFRLARDLDARLRQRAVVRRRNFALDAFDLAECKRLELFQLLGYSSVTAYARAVNGFGASKTSDLIRVAEACAELPLIRDAFLTGDLDWCAAREIVKRATPADEGDWLERARHLTVPELKALIHEEEPVYRRTLELSEQELAWIEAVANGVRREGGPFALGKALAEGCRRMLAGEGDGLGGVGYRLVVHYCERCERATRETSQGEVPVGPAELARVAGEAEVLDIREGPARISRAVPPKIRNYVTARDQGRCVIPGCTNPADHFHHEEGWENGHDPATSFGLCGSHHRSRHKGYLRIEGAAPDARVTLADGTFLGRAGDRARVTDDVPQQARRPATPTREELPPAEASAAPEQEFAHAKAPAAPEQEFAHAKAPAAPEQEFAHAKAPAAPEQELAHAKAPAAPEQEFAHANGPIPAPEDEFAHAKCRNRQRPARSAAGPTAGLAPDPAETAVKALTSLGLRFREAKASVLRVQQTASRRSWDAGELVAASLRELPPPG